MKRSHSITSLLIGHPTTPTSSPTCLPTYPLPNQAGAGPSTPPGEWNENGGHLQDGDNDSCIYYVKLINPKRKSNFVVRHWHIKHVFKSPEALKRKLVESFPNELSRNKGINFGLILPTTQIVGLLTTVSWKLCMHHLNRGPRLTCGVKPMPLTSKAPGLAETEPKRYSTLLTRASKMRQI